MSPSRPAASRRTRRRSGTAKWPASTPRRQITLTGGAAVGYDYLILATGVAAAYHGIPGAAEYSLGLYTRHEAIVLRDRS